MRLCLVEDDVMLGTSLCLGFRPHGYAVDWVQDGEAADEALRANSYWALILDLNLPRKPGLDVLAEMRRRDDDTPVIIMSARDRVADRIAGLDMGADDYLNKPFDLDELVARIRAVRRRREGRARSILSYGDIEFDPVGMTVRYRGQAVALRGRELAFLAALMEEPGKVLSREQLIDRVYGWETEIESNAVEVHIHALRKKFAPDVIRNIRGVGYRLASDVRI